MSILILIFLELFRFGINRLSIFFDLLHNFQKVVENSLLILVWLILSHRLALPFLLLSFLILIFINLIGHFLSQFIRRRERIYFYRSSYLSNFLSFLLLSEIFGIWDVVCFSYQNCVWWDESCMQLVKRINLIKRNWRSFGEFPEWFAVFGLGVQRVGIKQLHYVVSEKFVENICCYLYRIIEIGRSCFDEFSALS